MPRTPETVRARGVAVPVLPSLGGAAAPAAAASRVLGQQADLAFQENAQRIRQGQLRKRNQGTRMVSELANSLHVQFANRPDYDVFPEEHDAAFEDGLTEIIGGIGDDVVREDVETSGRRLMATQSRSMQIQADKLAGQANDAELEAALDADAAQFGLAMTEEAKADALRAGLTRIELQRQELQITDAEAIKMSQAFKQHAATAHIRNLINTNPDEAMRALSDDPIANVLDGNSREILRNSAEVALRQQQTQAAQADALRERETANEFIDRIYNPEHPKGFPIIDEIQSSTLGPRFREHFSKLVTAKSEGQNINFRDDTVINELYSRVHDETHPNPITDPSQLIPFLGMGLTTEEFNKLQADMVAISSDGTGLSKSDDRIWVEFLKQWETRISTGIFGRRLDPIGDRLMFDARLQLEARLRKGLEAGKAPIDMFNRTHKDYIGNGIEKFVRTDQEKGRDRSAERTRALERAKANDAKGPTQLFLSLQPEPDDDKVRREGESMPDFLKRTAPDAR